MSTYVTNKDIADILFNVAELLEVDEANRFRVNAYTNAVLTVLNSSEPMAKKITRGGDLSTLPSIGQDISRSIEEIVSTGELTVLEELEHTLPPQIVELSRVPGLGAKRIKIIQERYGTLTFGVVLNLARQGEQSRLPGIGPKIENAIVEHFSLAALQSSSSSSRYLNSANKAMPVCR